MFDIKRAFDAQSAQTNFQAPEPQPDPSLGTQAPVEPETPGGSMPVTSPGFPAPASAPTQPISSFTDWQQTNNPSRETPQATQPAQANTQPTEPDPLPTSFAGTPKPVTEETVLTWSAPNRPFKKRNKQFYTTVAIIVFLVSLILFFAGQFLPIAVVISVAFLAYVLSSVPPQEANYRITTFGIRVENNLYYWEELGRFWFDERYQQKMAHIEVARFPGRITLMLGEVQEEDLDELLSEVLPKEKPADTFFDSSAKWLQEKIPLDQG